MMDQRIPAGRKDLWFPITLLQRIHGIEPDVSISRLNVNGWRKKPGRAAAAIAGAGAFPQLAANSTRSH
jgi:hypothetical protein